MRKYIKTLFCILFSALLTVVNVSAEEVNLSLSSKSYVLMEAETGQILCQSNKNEKLPPASVTKIMTLLLIYEAIDGGKIKWDDPVSVSAHAASMGGSQVFLEENETQTVRDMTKCIAIASANDASVAMAEHIAGSEEGFVDMMNKRAKELNMNDTTFINACGLDADGHVTSANDIALMSRELITKHPQVTEFTTIWMDKITHKTRKGESEFGLTNTNKLLKWYNGATGLKTGSTGKALYCLSGTAERNGLKLIAVVMAAPDFKIRFHEVMKLFDYGFANYEVKRGVEKGTPIGQVCVYKGIDDYVNVLCGENFRFLAKKGDKGEITNEVMLEEGVKAPLKAGSKVGEIVYYKDGKEIGRADAVAESDMQKMEIGDSIKKIFRRYFIKQYI